MSLRSAIHALERKLGLGSYSLVPACSTCGSPPPPERIAYILRDGQAPGECPVCHHPTDPQGRAMGAPTPRGIHAVYICTDDVQAPYDA